MPSHGRHSMKKILEHPRDGGASTSITLLALVDVFLATRSKFICIALPACFSRHFPILVDLRCLEIIGATSTFTCGKYIWWIDAVLLEQTLCNCLLIVSNLLIHHAAKFDLHDRFVDSCVCCTAGSAALLSVVGHVGCAGAGGAAALRSWIHCGDCYCTWWMHWLLFPNEDLTGLLYQLLGLFTFSLEEPLCPWSIQDQCIWYQPG